MTTTTTMYAVNNVLPAGSVLSSSATVDSEETDRAIQRCLNRLARAMGDADGRQQIVREVLDVAAERILMLCGSTLRRRYPRLTKGPFNLQAEEVLSAVVERLIKAMRNVLPTNIREFFALTMKHIRWELNEFARELDTYDCEPLTGDVIAEEPPDERDEEPNADDDDETFSPLARRIQEAIDGLTPTDRDIFTLVRLQEMTQADAADELGISSKTVQRRLRHILPQLWAKLGERQPPRWAPPNTCKPLQPRFALVKGTTREQPSRPAA
jgi:RNA polymerase sigma factor (sigma-70 family)